VVLNVQLTGILNLHYSGTNVDEFCSALNLQNV